MADSNSLGLDFDKETAQEDAQPAQENEPRPEKKKPYVNPERVKTGGPQREKPSEEELAERMQRMREQNERIKQRRLDVEADEEAFRKTQEAERVKQAQTRKVQEGVDRTREQNARRKMDKMQNREWDSGKPAEGGDSVRGPRGGARGRGGPRGRGRGRGRPGRGAAPASTRDARDDEPAATTWATASEDKATA